METGSTPQYPVAVDPWAMHADTQHVFTPLDAPTSGPPPPDSTTPTSTSATFTAPGPAAPHPTGSGPTAPHFTGSGFTAPPSPASSPTGPHSGASGLTGPRFGASGSTGPQSGGPISFSHFDGESAFPGQQVVAPRSLPAAPLSTGPLSGSVLPAPPAGPHPARPEPTRPATIEVVQRHGMPLRWVITIAAVFLAGVVLATAIIVPRLIRADRNGTPPPTAAGPTGPTRADAGNTGSGTGGPGTGGPGSDGPSKTGPSKAGSGNGLVVAVAPDLSDDRADEVVAMLGVYFNGINAKDYSTVGTVLDPDGTTDPGDEDDMRELADGTRSTQDSRVTLTSLDDAGHGLLSAEVTFRSRQKAGDGPKDRRAETCTQWDVVYTLSHHHAYRIRKSHATSQPC